MKNKYPKEAVPRGTLVRSNKLNRLGVVMDAFYEDGVLHYNSFYLPNTAPGFYHLNLMPSVDNTVHGVIAEESEFDLTFYLMIGTVDLDDFDFVHFSGDYN